MVSTFRQTLWKLLLVLGLTVFLFVFFRSLLSQSFADQDKRLMSATGTNDIDTFLRRNFGFGLALSEGEITRAGLHCNNKATPQNSPATRGPLIVCESSVKNNAGYYVSWFDAYYPDDVIIQNSANILTKKIGLEHITSLSCQKDSYYFLNKMMPGHIADCVINDGSSPTDFSVLFLYPLRIPSVANAMVFYSTSDKSSHDELRALASKIVYLRNLDGVSRDTN